MKLKGLRVLVTGGAGLIGSWIVDKLFVEHEVGSVVILDNLDASTHAKGKPDWLHPRAEFIEGDVCDAAAVQMALCGDMVDGVTTDQVIQGSSDVVARMKKAGPGPAPVDVIFHLAAAGGFSDAFSKYMRSNGVGTALIFDVIRMRCLSQACFEGATEPHGYAGVRKIVSASSQAVYGEGMYRDDSTGQLFQPSDYRDASDCAKGLFEVRTPGEHSGFGVPVAITESSGGINCGSAYAISKFMQERATLTFAAGLGMQAVALRYGVTFGPRQSISNPYTGIISIFSTLILNDIPPVVYEDGQQTRDFIYVQDNAEANIFAMVTDSMNGSVYNVSGNKGTRIIDVAKHLCQLWGKDDLASNILQVANPGKIGAFRPWDVRHLVLDNSKLLAQGWPGPKVDIFEGMKRQVAWIRSVAEASGGLHNYFSDAEARLQRSGVIRSTEASSGELAR